MAYEEYLAITANPDPIERMLSHLKETHPDMGRVFTEGGCFQLYLMLRQMYPQAKPWTDIMHVLTEVDGRYYDICGRYTKLPPNFVPMDPLIISRAHRWCRRRFWPKVGEAYGDSLMPVGRNV